PAELAGVALEAAVDIRRARLALQRDVGDEALAGLGQFAGQALGVDQRLFAHLAQRMDTADEMRRFRQAIGAALLEALDLQATAFELFGLKARGRRTEQADARGM